METLPDHHTAHRIAELRAMQGLPFALPSGHTVYRQSDFEKTPIWRLTFLAAFIVIVTNVLSPDPQTVQVPVTATQATV